MECRIGALPTKPKVVEVQSPVEQSPSSSSSSLIPFVTIGNTSPVSILRETKSERRIRKLEDEVKYMRRKICKLEEKDQDTIVIKKFDLDTGKKVDLIT
ncbi:hypothetical protein DPMN_074659 [Dreissena polymorpha]|uniref:Uncharacterized protein n=1 Tax=Dreissena polymorpha TaxID=45954 RepID=A0A9D3YJ21_DREPO|nr:hypothetical protein DPMN_074659 [Dreissena polymorpha]